MRMMQKGSHNMTRRTAGAGLVVLLGVALFVPSAMAASPQQATQTNERMAAATALTYDTLDAILKDLASYKFDEGVGAPLRLDRKSVV